MHCPTENADLTQLAGGSRALEIGLALLILGYLFRNVLAFAAWTLEFLWS